jgi:hypothetical protein
VAGTKRVTGLLVASLTTAVLASACGADLQAHTQDMVPAIPGINASTEDHTLGVRNLLFRYSGPEGYRVGSTAPLEVRVFNNNPTPAKLTCVKVATGAGVVTLVGSATPTGTPSATPTATPTAAPTPSASGTRSASPNGKSSATPSPSASASTAPVPAGPPSVPACGAAFSVDLAPFGFALLTASTGRYLAVSGFNHDLIPGDPKLGLTFTFDSGGTTQTVTTEAVPIGVPLSPLPRIPGNPSEEK